MIFTSDTGGAVSIAQICHSLESVDDDTLSFVRRELPYKIPSTYMHWKYLSCMIAAGLVGLNSIKGDLATFLHCHRTSLWFVKRAPIYCLSPELLKAFDGTDIESRSEVLKLLKPAVYSMILLFPNGFIKSGEGHNCGYAIINVSDRDNPAESCGSYKGFKVQSIPHEHQINIHFSTVDDAGNVYYSGMGLHPSGDVEYNESANVGLNNANACDRKFLKRMRSIVLQSLFVLQYEPELLGDFAARQYTKSGKGFNNFQGETFLRPRLLDFPQRKFSAPKLSTGTHASPRPHIRRGHLRVVNEERIIWIRPTFVGGQKNE